METKLTYPYISSKLFEIANQEYNHINVLHELLVKLTHEEQEKGNAQTPEMLEKWHEHHRDLITRKHDVKIFLSMYKP